MMMQTQTRREDVIRHLLESMKQPVGKKKESRGSVPTKKPGGLLLLELGIPVPGESLTLEIKDDNKTIVDWVTGRLSKWTRQDENEGPRSGESPNLSMGMVGSRHPLQTACR